ncbi:MAG: hypothetical protein COB69_09630 [Phycisphaera sp.]|nr:MAG: hypothetical protein COB69_09630 [Phycisphaera sp.]
MIHVAVVHKQYAELILAGEKTAELRLTKNRIVPFGRVHNNDTVYIKVASGPICAVAKVASIEAHEDLTPAKIRVLRKEVNDVVMGDSAFWNLKRTARYATVVYLKNIKPCDDGPDVSAARAANPRSAWLILER